MADESNDDTAAVPTVVYLQLCTYLGLRAFAFDLQKTLALGHVLFDIILVDVLELLYHTSPHLSLQPSGVHSSTSYTIYTLQR